MKRLLLVATLALTACSQNSEKSNTFNFLDGIFSNRPQNRTQFISILKLSQPALLSALEKKNGKNAIRQELADAIELEQNLLIKKLQEISPEIKVIYRYRMVLNAVTISAPISAAEKVSTLQGVTIETPSGFARPIEVSTKKDSLIQNISNGNTSVEFIGAGKAHAQNIRGQNMKVGVIDTGIDYTHSMLGGPGSAEIYKQTDPNTSNNLFPNNKVVGGIDLVGTDYNAASENFSLRVPKPDNNPLDEGGHGSHVGGTIAGIGDGKETYSGVAPDAALHAIKVFGKTGSTSDEVVIAGLEYAADPNSDLSIADQLDVVNLSLGSEYGFSHAMYNEAVRNLTDGGTVVVASAGNSGNQDFITGAPAAMDAALSVAASIDDMAHNWQFPVSIFDLSNGEKVKVEAVEGTVGKPIEESTVTDGELVYIGFADAELSDDVKQKLNGKVALIDRGRVNFSVKIERAEKGGAIGVVVANNQPGEALAMGGGDKPAAIPAIMVKMDVGQALKESMRNGPVVVHFKTEDKISRPELIDTLTDFSSKGPRTLDAVLKPEISAPGANIISAEMGKGSKGVAMSGTSMAAPHMAGVMALIKQSHPNLTASELKSLVMGTSKTITAQDKRVYPLSRQGAGRVQIENAINAQIITRPSAISLGLINIEKSKTISQSITIKNISNQALSLNLKLEGHSAMSMAAISLSLDPQSEKTVDLKLVLNASQLTQFSTEVDAFVKVYSQDKEIFKIATLALVKKISRIQSQSLVIKASSNDDSLDSLVELKLKNNSSQGGDVLLFNKINLDARKPAVHGVLLSRICDLQAAGYRLMDSKLQIVVKLYEPVTSWHLCEVSILLDNNGDSIADQELAGAPGARLSGVGTTDFKSMLIDAEKARSIRKEFEQNFAADPSKAVLNYTPALQDLGDMTIFNNSTIAIVEIDKNSLITRPSGEIAIKIATTSADDYNVESDDFLGSEKKWRIIDISDKAPAFRNMPAMVHLDGQAEVTVNMTKGQSTADLLMLMPHNMATPGTLQLDKQIESPKASFEE